VQSIRIATLLLVAALVACSAGSPAALGTAFEGPEVRFVAPPGWELRTSGDTRFGPWLGVAHIANQPLRDPCSGGDPGVCPGPVEGLRDGGLLLSWFSRHCAGPQCERPTGELTTVGGRITSIAEVSVIACGAIGQTEETAYWVAVSPQRLDMIVVCARHPSAATLAALRGFLDAVDWRTP
jgi:hypothetical protein